MENKMKSKSVICSVAAMCVTCAIASPLSLPVKAVIRGAEKVGFRAGAHAAGEAAAHGGVALAKATAKHEAAKAVVVGAERSGAQVAGHVAGDAAARGGSALAAATAARESCRALAKVSGKQIVAGGVATAAVVGTYKVADGAQEMCEGIGDSVKQNPDVAVKVADGLFSLPRTMLAVLAASVVALLGWFFWPFLLLARNAIRLAAARRACAHATVPTAPAVPPADPVEADAVHSGSAGFARVRALAAMSGIGLIAVVGAAGLSGGDRDGGVGMPTNAAVVTQGSSDAARAKRAESVARLRREYEGAIDRAYENFVAEVESLSKAEFARVRALIPNVVKQYGAFTRCMRLVKTLAYDKVTGKNTTEESVNEDLEVSFYGGLYSARDRVAECLVRLSSALEAARSGFAMRLGDELASAGLPGDDEYLALLEDCGSRIEESKRKLTEGQIVATVVVGFEAIMIRSSVAAISKMLGAIAGRVGGTAAVSLGLSFVDGPLPVADMIGGLVTVACLGWAAVEVNDAAKVLPGKMAEALEGATRECEQHCRDEALKAGSAMVAQYKTGASK